MSARSIICFIIAVIYSGILFYNRIPLVIERFSNQTNWVTTEAVLAESSSHGTVTVPALGYGSDTLTERHFTYVYSDGTNIYSFVLSELTKKRSSADTLLIQYDLHDPTHIMLNSQGRLKTLIFPVLILGAGVFLLILSYRNSKKQEQEMIAKQIAHYEHMKRHRQEQEAKRQAGNH